MTDTLADITSGLPRDQAAWAGVSLEAVIAPAWEDGFGALHGQLVSLGPDKRWAAIVAAHYTALLEPMRAVAHELAAQDPPPEGIDWREVEAGIVLGFLDALAEEMGEAAPDAFELLAPELADAAERCRECLPSGPYGARTPR